METDLQKKIENIVTQNRGYQPIMHLFSDLLLGTEIELQLTLAEMEHRDGKLKDYRCLTYGRIQGIIDDFKKINLPLNTITTAKGFDEAFRTRELSGSYMEGGYIITFGKIEDEYYKNILTHGKDVIGSGKLYRSGQDYLIFKK